MRPHEKKLLLKFLEDHYDRLGNAGCNDFMLSEHGLTSQEQQQLLEDYCDHMRKTGGWTDTEVSWQFNKKHKEHVEDFCLLGMLIEKFREEISFS